MRRRHALLGLCCAGAWPALRGLAATPGLVTVEIAPGLHVRRGVDEDASPANRDAIANLGFVVGRDSVAVFDPGGSLADGLALRDRIRAVTDRPIRYVLLSHVHPDHIFGAAAFRPDAPSFVGHASLPAALQARGAFYADGLSSVTGDHETIVIPDRLVSGVDQIDLGDRVLQLRAHPVAHTNCDLSALDMKTGTWLSGDLVFVGRVPSLDGNLQGWIAELEALRDLPARKIVPGHGPVRVDWPAATDDILRYLRALRTDVAALIAGGGGIEQAPEAAAAERSRWRLFDDYNGHNATEAFKELEWN